MNYNARQAISFVDRPIFVGGDILQLSVLKAKAKCFEYRGLLLPIFVFIISGFLFEYAYLFEQVYVKVMSASSYLSWHTTLEFISVLVSVCVFIIPYYSYKQNKRLRGLAVAHIFLIMGCIDFFHALSFKGMMDFLITNDTANRATTFWIIARLVGAIGVTAVSCIRINRKSNIDKRIFLIISIVFVLAVLVIATYFPGIIPEMYNEETGVTQVKKVLEYVVIIFLVVAGFQYIRQYMKNKNNSNLLFSVAIITSIFSELSFVRYFSVYDMYNFLGHIYKFISYFMVFRVAFINNIEQPYLALYAAKNKIKADARNLNRLVEERTRALEVINQKLLDDLEYARDIQLAMLPEKLPNNEEVTFSAKYYPAERVSGDFYNIFRLDEKHIGMYIGDVSGHGVPASMLTIFLNQSIKTIRELEGNRSEIINPSTVLSNLYHLFNKVHFKADLYILVLYAIYNTDTRELVYSSAGMNAQPIIIKKNQQIHEIEIQGLPICKLGDICSPEYKDKSVRLESGDRVFFYTDGLTELNRKLSGNAYSIDSLKALLGKYGVRDLECIYDEIDKEITLYSKNGGIKDDVTFFTLQVT